ncbi:sugar transferase [Novosphingobium sp.]|uniref:sugar transferase n=1 Tax=Novosphingobium sp. TaxID=1874826 RepID=UPI002733097B|nr:sugar transferase [Novosphingobium sp.]MDP3906629.1 sugar transferase [Novosphingobium sp.]
MTVAASAGPDRPIPVVASLERRRLQIYLAQLLADGGLLLLGFGAAGYVYLGSPFDESLWPAAQLLLPVFWAIALTNRTYSVPALVNGSYGLQRVVAALGLAVLALIVLLFLTRSSLLVSRAGFGLGCLAAAFMIVWGRVNLQSRIRSMVGPRAENLLLIDDGGPPLDAPNALRINAAQAAIVPSSEDPHALNRIAQLIRNMDRVVVSCPPERRHLWALVLKGGHMRGEIVDNEVETLGIIGTSRLDGISSVVVSSGPLGLRSRVLKRLFDLALTVPAVIVLGLPMLVIAALIHFQDGGPALFLQRRVGRNNQFFWIYKFRSMRVAASDAAGAQSTRRDDDRITRFGAFLRKTSIDELPQLFNVLKGEMSLVGPRPHALASQAGDRLFYEIDSRYAHRHALKPGLTGLAQIRGFRGATEQEADLTQRLQADLEYQAGWSILRDLAIILRTLRVVIHDRAY